MGLTPRKLLEYFYKEELQDVLSKINVSQSGYIHELIERILVEWPAHNKKWKELLKFIDKPKKPRLSQICEDFSLGYKGKTNVLEKRVVKEIDPSNISSKFSRKIIVVILGVIIAIVGGTTIVFDINVGENIISNSPDSEINIGQDINIPNNEGTVIINPNQDISKEIEDTSIIPYLDVWKTFKENRPYTISWTDCNFGTSNDLDKTRWNFSMKPIMLNKYNDPALIPFNISYYFRFEGLIDEQWRQFPNAPPETTQKLTLYFKQNPWIEFSDMTQAIEDATSKNITKIQIIKSKSSFIPYVESIDDNLLDDYEPDRTDYVVTQFEYDSNEWKHEPPQDAICSNLFDR